MTKVEQIREDLGSAGPVIAAQIEEAMLGRRATLDDTRFSGAGCFSAGAPAGATDARAARRAPRRARQSRTALHLQPDRVERVVSDRARARSPAGAAARRRAGHLRGAGADGQLVAGDDRLEHPARPDERRPITFDHEVARDRTDVVLAHLGHPLVRMALALLRAEVWGTGHHLHRVTLRYAEPSLGTPVAVAHGRLVITGASGHRLHEQLIFAGLRLTGERPSGSGSRRPTRRSPSRSTRRSRPTLVDRLVPRAEAAPSRCARRCRRAPATAPAS